MNEPLAILALQAAGRLGLRGVPDPRALYGAPRSALRAALGRAWRAAASLVASGGATWRDVFEASDISAERLMVAREIGVGAGDRVLDLGCGRGYFSLAAALLGAEAVCLDLGRAGGVDWWRGVVEAAELLGVGHRVSAVEADAAEAPLAGSRFDVVAAVHSVRGFGSTGSLRVIAAEMRRLVSAGGVAALVEALPRPLDERQEVNVRLLALRLGARGGLGYLEAAELLRVLRGAGFRRIELHVLSHGLCAAPGFFYVDPAGLGPRGAEEYMRAVEAARRVGEALPPVAVAIGRP